MLRLYFLHGFLGCKEDWDSVIALLPEFACTAISYPFIVPSDGILIGYSMGGRIALQSLAAARIIISGHPGLSTEEEKAQRWKADLEWIDKLKTVSMPEFLDQWYKQPLFDSLRQHPDFPHILSRRLKQDPTVLIEQLTKHSLAHQSYLIPSNTLFVYGEKDLKYAKFCTTLNGIKIKGAGHALHLETPQECALAIRKWIVHRHPVS